MHFCIGLSTSGEQDPFPVRIQSVFKAYCLLLIAYVIPIMLYRTILCYVMLYGVLSCHIILFHLSCHIILCHCIVLGSIFIPLSHSGGTEESQKRCNFVILVLQETAVYMCTCTFKCVHLHTCALAAFSSFKFCASALWAKARHACCHPVSQRRFTPCREYFSSQRRCSSYCVSEGAESGRRGRDLAET